MIKKNIVEIDSVAVLKAIHEKQETFFAQYIEQLEKAKESLSLNCKMMTHAEIEEETRKAMISLNRWSMVIGAAPFVLAGCAYIFG